MSPRWIDEEEVDEWEAKEERMQQDRWADEQYEAHVRDGGLALDAAIAALSAHYGLRVWHVKTGRIVKASLRAPNDKVVAAFTLIYDGERWHLDGFHFYHDGLRSELVAAMEAVERVPIQQPE